MATPPAPPPEAEALRIARIRQHLSVREAAQRAGVSASLWRQVEAGYMTPVKGVHTPKIAPAATLARMALAVALQAEHLETHGQRPDAAKILREILRQQEEARADAPEPLPSGDSSMSPRTQEPAAGTPAVPVGFVSPEMIERARPYADEIWRDVLRLAMEAGYAPDPTAAEQVPDPGSKALFPGSEADRMAWDSAAGFSALAKTWLVAALRSTVAAAHERGTGDGFSRSA